MEQTCFQVATSSLHGFMSVFSVCLAIQGVHVHALARTARSRTWPFFYVPLAIRWSPSVTRELPHEYETAAVSLEMTSGPRLHVQRNAWLVSGSRTFGGTQRPCEGGLGSWALAKPSSSCSPRCRDPVHTHKAHLDFGKVHRNKASGGWPPELGAIHPHALTCHARVKKHANTNTTTTVKST